MCDVIGQVRAMQQQQQQQQQGWCQRRGGTPGTY